MNVIKIEKVQICQNFFTLFLEILELCREQAWRGAMRRKRLQRGATGGDRLSVAPIIDILQV
jgi:hypothetical protein